MRYSDSKLKIWLITIKVTQTGNSIFDPSAIISQPMELEKTDPDTSESTWRE